MVDPTRHSEEPAAQLDPLRDVGYLGQQLRWLVALRWIAVASVTVVTAAAVVLGAVERAVPLFGIVAIAFAGNTLFWIHSRGDVQSGSAERVRAAIAGELLFDCAVLTALLYWSGSADNPFVLFFAFPMAIAGMLLPLRLAAALAVGALVLHGGAMLAQQWELIPHYSLTLGGHGEVEGAGQLWKSPVYVAGYLAAFLLTELGVIYFVASLARRVRDAERARREHERVALSRERLARIGSLVAGVAHTVRNPLHGMQNCVDLLRASAAGDASTQELLDLMEEGTQRIETITSRLLAATRDDHPRRRRTEVGALIDEVLSFVSPIAGRRGVSVRAAKICAAEAEIDVDRLTEALVNVVENAVQASFDGGEVEVLVTRPAGLADTVRIEVGDHGHGMPDEVRERVFEPFFTTKPVGEGSGLGLAIARRVVEEHGGEVAVHSSPGLGTTVRIDIPGSAQQGEAVAP